MFRNAACQFAQAARDQTEMAVAQALAQTQANMIADLWRIEQVDGNQVSRQRMQLHLMRAVPEDAMTVQRVTLTSDAFAQILHRDDLNPFENARGYGHGHAVPGDE